MSQFRDLSWPNKNGAEVIALELVQLPEPMSVVCDHRGTEDSAGKGNPAVKGGTAAASALVRLNPAKLCPEGGEAHHLVLCHQEVPMSSFCSVLCPSAASLVLALACF